MGRKRNTAIKSWSRRPNGVRIAGCQIQMGKKQARLVMYLFEDRGRVIPYEKLCSIIGGKRARAKLNVRAHIARANEKFAALKLPITITVAKGIGYALCEVGR